MSAKILKIPNPAPIHPSMEPLELIENYLDHLCGPLIGLVPYPDRQRFRDEAKYNILERMDLFVNDGLPETEAALQAIDKYGETETLSDKFLEEWMQHQQTGVFRTLGRPNAYAAMFFSQAVFICLLLTIIRVFFPSEAPAMITQAELRNLVPGFIPVPDTSGMTIAYLAAIIFLPIIAGAATGWCAVVQAGRATFRVLMLLTVGTFFLGSTMLPQLDGIFFALTLMMWWLPTGCLTAHMVAAVVWRRRCAIHSFPTRRKL